MTGRSSLSVVEGGPGSVRPTPSRIASAAARRPRLQAAPPLQLLALGDVRHAARVSQTRVVSIHVRLHTHARTHTKDIK